MPFQPLKFNAAVLLITLGTAACISGPKPPDDNFLSRLNGASYDTPLMIGGIPVGKRNLTRILKAQVQCNAGLGQVPVRNAQVDLLANGKIVGSAFTDQDGWFSIAFDVESGREYEVKIATSKWNHAEKVYSGPRGLATVHQSEIFIACN